MVILSPGLLSAMVAATSSGSPIFTPSTSTMMSPPRRVTPSEARLRPARNPASAAGLPGATSCTSAPSLVGTSFASSGTGEVVTPM
jgi:hypothetical protein